MSQIGRLGLWLNDVFLTKTRMDYDTARLMEMSAAPRKDQTNEPASKGRQPTSCSPTNAHAGPGGSPGLFATDVWAWLNGDGCTGGGENGGASSSSDEISAGENCAMEQSGEGG